MHDLAIGQYEQILRGAPASPLVLLGLGAAYQSKGDTSRAIANFQQAAALAPKDPAVWTAAADALQTASRNEEAIAHYRHVLQLQPANATALNNTAFLLAETGGNLDEALQMAQKSLQIEPRQPRFADTLGWIYLKKHLSDSALRVFQNLTQQYPDNPTFHYHFGMVLLNRGDKTGAKSEWSAALAHQPAEKDRREIQAALAKIG